jgi:hypothetical protein
LTYCHNATLGRRDFYRQLCLALVLRPSATAAAIFYAVSEQLQEQPIRLLRPRSERRDALVDLRADLTARIPRPVDPDFDGNRCSRGTRVERFQVVTPREGRKILGTRPESNYYS